MAVSAMVTMSVGSGAADYNIKVNKKITVPTNISKNYYIFTIDEETDVWIEYTTYTSCVDFRLDNEKDEYVSDNLYQASVGNCKHNGWNVEAWWDKYKEKGQGRFRYTLKPGTYRLKVERVYDTGTKKISFTVSVPVDDSSAEIDYLSLTMTEGTKLKLGAILTGSSKKSVKWTSSNKTAVSVTSKGTLVAKAEGTAIVTGKLGSSSIKIKVTVTD